MAEPRASRRRPTILQVIPSLDTGGAELSTIEIAAALSRAGARALVATEGGRMANQLIAAGGEIVPLPVATKSPWQVYANAGRLARLIETADVDLVHARSRAPAWSARIAARRTGRPFVTTYHGAYAETGPLKRAYNRVMASGDVVIANSAYTAELIRTRYDTLPERLRVIHRGVDEVAFDRTTLAPARIAALRAAWGVPNGTRVILQAARLTRWKGQTVMIDALARLAAQTTARAGPNAGRPHAGGLAHGATAPMSGDAARDADPWVAILAGDDQGRADYTAELQAAIARHGLADRVRLVGHVEDMAAAFALADVAVIASTEPEAFGRTAIEAQRMGCPVIATRLGAPPETVLAPPAVSADARTGWLVPAGDAALLAAALAEALSLPDAARLALADRAAHHAGTRFTLDAMRRATLAVYDELLGSDLVQRFAAPPLATVSGPHA